MDVHSVRLFCCFYFTFSIYLRFAPTLASFLALFNTTGGRAEVKRFLFSSLSIGGGKNAPIEIFLLFYFVT